MNKTPGNHPESTRAFVALDITAEMRNELARLQKELQPRLEGDINWVKPENIHLTLRFLGSIAPAQVQGLKAVLQDIAKKNKRFGFELGALNAFPHTHNPHIIWVGVKSGFNELNQISGELEAKLVQAGFTAAERPFYPHLTLARVKHLKDRHQFSQCLDEIPSRYVSVQIERLALFKSVLHSNGPIYTLLAEFPLL